MSRALFDEMRRRMEHFRRSEQKVARFVLRNPDEVIHMRIVDLATEAKVSEPTVVRFCRALGCNGFQDFKLQLAQSLAVGEAFLTSDTPATAPGELPPFWFSVLSEARAAIREVERQVSPKDVLEAAAILAGAGRVATFGVGLSRVGGVTHHPDGGGGKDLAAARLGHGARDRSRLCMCRRSSDGARRHEGPE